MKQKEITIHPWDAAEGLESKEDVAAYLNAAIEDGDAAIVVAALGDIARPRGMAQIASEAGLGRARLHKALATTGNPKGGPSPFWGASTRLAVPY